MTHRLAMTIVVSDEKQRTLLEKVAKALPWAEQAPENAEHMGVLFYEPGPNASQDLPEIGAALESGAATDVVIVGEEPSPEMLIEAMRCGIREYLPYPLDPKEIRSVLLRIRRRVATESTDEERGRVSLILGARQGVGNTTVAVNLAAMFAKAAPEKTVLVDFARPAGEVPYFLEIACDYTWGDLVEDVSRLDETYLSSAVSDAGNGLAVLAAPDMGQSADQQALRTLFDTLRGSYEHVIVDGSMELDGSLCQVAEEADDVILVTELTLPSLAAAKKAIDAFSRVDPDASTKLRVVASRVVKNGGIEVQDAAEALGRSIAWSIPDVHAEASAAINQGVPLMTASPKSHALKPLAEIADELGLPKPKKSGLLDKLPKLFGKKKDEPDGTGVPA